MSLDDELRSAFAQEAATRIAPPPDPDALIRGGRVRRRRRNLERAGASIAAVALVGVGGYAVNGLGTPREAGVASPPSGSTTHLPGAEQGRPELAAGTHRRFVGYSATGPRIEAEFTVDGDNWSDGDFPLVAERLGSVFAGVGVYQPRTLAAGNGCLEDPVIADLGRTPRRLAEQLAELPRSTVIEAPTATKAFGHTGLHLRLRIGGECSSYYRVAETPMGERGITYRDQGAAPVDVLIDFWVIDVDGALVVVDQWHEAGASQDLVEQAERARKSIQLLVGD